MGEKAIRLDIAHVQPYFHEPQASENTAQECNHIAFSHIRFIIYNKAVYYVISILA